MVAELIDEKVEFLNMICDPIWFCIRYNESIEMSLVAKMRF